MGPQQPVLLFHLGGGIGWHLLDTRQRLHYRRRPSAKFVSKRIFENRRSIREGTEFGEPSANQAVPGITSQRCKPVLDCSFLICCRRRAFSLSVPDIFVEAM